jgi:hypothetical protein
LPLGGALFLLRIGSVPLFAERYRRRYVALGGGASARTFDTQIPHDKLNRLPAPGELEIVGKWAGYAGLHLSPYVRAAG